MLNKDQIVTKAIEAIESSSDFKLRWHNQSRQVGENTFYFDDGIIEIGRQNEINLQFPVAVKQELRQYQLAQMMELQDGNDYFLFIADTISSTFKEILRDKKIGYIDTAGNMFINTPNFYAWVDGRKLSNPIVSNYNRAFAKTGLRVIFYLLLNKEAVNFSYRKLSEATGVSVGNISNVMSGLNVAGYLLKMDTKKYILKDKKQLLSRWISGYNETLKPSLLIGKYRIRQRNWKDLPTNKGKDFWSGEVAADLLTNNFIPEELNLYTNRGQAEEIRGLGLFLGAENGNLTLYQKFWNDSVLDKEWYVPPLLVYTDLVLTDDPRCIEVAQIIYNQFLKDKFEEPQRRRTEASN